MVIPGRITQAKDIVNLQKVIFPLGLAISASHKSKLPHTLEFKSHFQVNSERVHARTRVREHSRTRSRKPTNFFKKTASNFRIGP